MMVIMMLMLLVLILVIAGAGEGAGDITSACAEDAIEPEVSVY